MKRRRSFLERGGVNRSGVCGEYMRSDACWGEYMRFDACLRGGGEYIRSDACDMEGESI